MSENCALCSIQSMDGNNFRLFLPAQPRDVPNCRQQLFVAGATFALQPDSGGEVTSPGLPDDVTSVFPQRRLVDHRVRSAGSARVPSCE